MKQIDCQVLLRFATPKDRQHLIRIQHSAIVVLTASKYSPRQIKALLRHKSKLRIPFETVLIAEIKGCIIGFAAISESRKKINSIFVAPEFARQGVGSLLIWMLERIAIQSNIPVLWVSVSLADLKFYQANGYSKVRRLFLPVGSIFIPTIWMKKRLLPVTQKEIAAETIQLLTAIVLICLTIFSIRGLKEICQFYFSWITGLH